MGIKYSIPKINPRAFGDRINKELGAIMNLEVTHIKTRTGQSRDAEGASFTEYSPKYEQFRREKGRGPTPDLLFTGAMLRAMSSSAARSGNIYTGSIFFSVTAEAKKARGNNNKRRFFAFDDLQVERITRKVKQLFGLR